MNHNAFERKIRLSIVFGPRIWLAIVLLSFATERPAAAYADPGSGALLWQFLAASFVGMLFYFRKITTWVRSKTTKKGSQD